MAYCTRLVGARVHYGDHAPLLIWYESVQTPFLLLLYVRRAVSISISFRQTHNSQYINKNIHWDNEAEAIQHYYSVFVQDTQYITHTVPSTFFSVCFDTVLRYSTSYHVQYYEVGSNKVRLCSLCALGNSQKKNIAPFSLSRSTPSHSRLPGFLKYTTCE